MDYPKSISKEDINKLPQQEFAGKIFIITDVNSAIRAAQDLSKAKIIGFDTETRPSFKSDQQFKVSLLQLVTEESAYLFRLRWTGLPQEVVQILSDPSIQKVGVAIRDDIRALQKLEPFEAAGFTDIAHEAKIRGFTNFGLRGLTAIFLSTRLSKTAKLTNWDNEVLSHAQENYAANDGLVSIKIYQRLMTLPVTHQKNEKNN